MKRLLVYTFILLIIFPINVLADNYEFFNIGVNNYDIYYNNESFHYVREDSYYYIYSFEIYISYYDNQNNLLGTQTINAHNKVINGPTDNMWIAKNAVRDEENRKITVDFYQYDKPDNVHIYEFLDTIENGDRGYVPKPIIYYDGDIVRFSNGHTFGTYAAYYSYQNKNIPEGNYGIPNSILWNNCNNSFVFGHDYYEDEGYDDKMIDIEGPYYLIGFLAGTSGSSFDIYHYEIPQLNMTCDKEILNKGDIANCTLSIKYNYLPDGLKLQLDTTKLNILDINSSLNYDLVKDESNIKQLIFDVDTTDQGIVTKTLLNMQVQLEDGEEESTDQLIIATSPNYFDNMEDANTVYVFNKTTDYVEPDVKGVDIENPKTGTDKTLMHSIIIMISVSLFTAFVIVDKKKVFKKI